jgi:dolichol-phosphate mannosyltransferase
LASNIKVQDVRQDHLFQETGISMQIGIVIPTYNEVENLSGLVSTIYSFPLDISLLIVDDNSPDGTGQLADELADSKTEKMAVLHNPGKMGFASAYLQGFRYFLDKKVDVIGQMDADFSHDPATLTAMVNQLEGCGMVIGSRYIQGGGVDRNWPAWRKKLSAFGNSYARQILHLPYQDVTSGFRLWRRETLQEIPFNRIQSNGYVFQIELVYLAHLLGFPISEVPIFFAERQGGRSKMSLKIQIEAALRVWQLPLLYRDIHASDQAAIVN